MLRVRMLITSRWLVCVFTAWIAAGCALVAPKFERPEISVASIELVSGSLLQQNFLVKLNIQNPNDRALPVTGVHAELNVAGERLASGVSNRPFVVPAQGTTQFDMTITANMASVLLKLSQRADNHSDSIDYDMTGSASIDLPFLRDLAFHQKGAFSLRAPQ
ncbi:MAG: LEA type 2 family protein [Steroidobacteraceae bacterium]